MKSNENNATSIIHYYDDPITQTNYKAHSKCIA